MKKIKLLIYSVIFAFLYLSLVQIFIDSLGASFYLELLGLFFLMGLTFIGYIGYTESWGEKFFFFTFLFYIGNLAVLWYTASSLYISLLFVALLGFVISIPHNSKNSVRKETTIETYPEPYSEVFDVPEVTHSPGKYVASKKGKYYHEPKSEWAKKIKENNQVWFQTKEDAWEKGYKAHSDVE
jgi:hypothetical protein